MKTTDTIRQIETLEADIAAARTVADGLRKELAWHIADAIELPQHGHKKAVFGGHLITIGYSAGTDLYLSWEPIPVYTDPPFDAELPPMPTHKEASHQQAEAWARQHAHPETEDAPPTADYPTLEEAPPTEEDGDEIFTPIPRTCQKFACRHHQLENRDGFMVCPRCHASYRLSWL